MAASKDRIAERLAQAQVVINRALSDPDLQAVLTAFGYSVEKIRVHKRIR